MWLQKHLKGFFHDGKESQDGQDGAMTGAAGSPGSRKRRNPELYEAVKRQKHESDVLRKEWPRIFVNEQGKPSSLSREGERWPLYMGDVQSLLFFSVLGNRTPVLPRWVSIVNVTKVSHVVLIHIEGVGLSDVQQNTPSPSQDSSTVCDAANKGTEGGINHQEGNCVVDAGSGRASWTRQDTDKSVNSSGGLPAWLKTSMPRTSHHMHHSLEIVAPSIHGACPVEELMQMKSAKFRVSVIEEDLKDYDEEKMKNKTLKPSESFLKFLPTVSSNSDDKLHPSDKFSRLKLLMKAGDLARNNFPLPLSGYKGWSNKEFVLTSDSYKEVTSCSPMFGLDCEMCLTSIHTHELTSVSIVNEKLELVYHTLVLPYNPVINFLTKFSGITPEKLENVTKRLEDVQQDLRKLLPPDAILVGHSINNDLGSLKMMHPYIIDSSLAYNLTGRRNFRSSLKLLCEIFLDERIQIAGVGGHDPTEDAISTLKLIQLKLKKDEEYGNVIQGWEPPAATVQGWQQIQMRRPELEKDSTEDTKKKQSEQNNNASTEKAIGPFIRKDIYVFQKMESRNIAIITTAACLKNYLGVLASLYNTPSVEVLAGNKQVSQRAGDFVASSNLTHIHMQMGKKLSQCPDEATRQKQLRKLDKRLQRIHKAAAPKSVHIYVFSGSSLEVPFKERSNGFVLVGIKDLPFRT